MSADIIVDGVKPRSIGIARSVTGAQSGKVRFLTAFPSKAVYGFDTSGVGLSGTADVP